MWLGEKGTIKGVKFRRKGSQEFTAHAPLTIVCDGCCSNLRRYLCNPKVEIPSCFVGLILEDCQLPYANHAHVILGDPSLVSFYPIDSREICCLVDVPGRQVPSISSGEWLTTWKQRWHPSRIIFQVPPELYTAFLVAIDKGNIKAMPTRSMPATAYHTPGALLMGDAVNMRHPITGGGMVVALSDVVALRNLPRPLRNLNDVPALFKYLESFYTLRKVSSLCWSFELLKSHIGELKGN
ncbi:hypothetical protein C1H46_011931 [Malus baccata]|uniref:Squalene monooxygenase n=1 Tax=Malus baccata TaxID=106549 RepID=A0A540MUD4_MALBA|nr:hypothetical protein C1H46_011931 [Malus baccata]